MVGLCVSELRCAPGPSRRTDALRFSQGVRLRAGRSVCTRPRAECLEGRTLLAAAPVPAGAEFRVNTTVAGSQELFAEAPHAGLCLSCPGRRALCSYPPERTLAPMVGD